MSFKRIIAAKKVKGELLYNAYRGGNAIIVALCKEIGNKTVCLAEFCVKVYEEESLLKFGSASQLYARDTQIKFLFFSRSLRNM